MPAYTIPAGSNYTITQFVRSRAIKSLTFMVGNGKIKRLTLFPEVLIFNRPIFFILSPYFTQTEQPYPQRDNDYYAIYYIQDQSRDWHWLLDSTPDGSTFALRHSFARVRIKWIFSGSLVILI